MRVALLQMDLAWEDVAENHRRAEYYPFTAQGRRALAQEQASWARVTAAIGRIMQTA